MLTIQYNLKDIYLHTPAVRERGLPPLGKSLLESAVENVTLAVGDGAGDGSS